MCLTKVWTWCPQKQKYGIWGVSIPAACPWNHGLSFSFFFNLSN